MLLFNKIIK